VNRRSTFSEMRWPTDDQSLAQANDWAGAVSLEVLKWTWLGFDLLQKDDIKKTDLSQPIDQLERDLTSKHFIYINRVWAIETEGYSSITPHHEYPEMETRPAPPGRPPAYDFAFVWSENFRVAWAIEAKVVSTPKAIAEYKKDVDKFLTGVAAPLIGHGGLIAYLLSGNAGEFFEEVEKRLSTKYEPTPEIFQKRTHQVSKHIRRNAPELILHHMLMSCVA